MTLRFYFNNTIPKDKCRRTVAVTLCDGWMDASAESVTRDCVKGPVMERTILKVPPNLVEFLSTDDGIRKLLSSVLCLPKCSQNSTVVHFGETTQPDVEVNAGDEEEEDSNTEVVDRWPDWGSAQAGLEDQISSIQSFATPVFRPENGYWAFPVGDDGLSLRCLGMMPSIAFGAVVVDLNQPVCEIKVICEQDSVNTPVMQKAEQSLTMENRVQGQTPLSNPSPVKSVRKKTPRLKQLKPSVPASLTPTVVSTLIAPKSTPVPGSQFLTSSRGRAIRPSRKKVMNAPTPAQFLPANHFEPPPENQKAVQNKKMGPKSSAQEITLMKRTKFQTVNPTGTNTIDDAVDTVATDKTPSCRHRRVNPRRINISSITATMINDAVPSNTVNIPNPVRPINAFQDAIMLEYWKYCFPDLDIRIN